VETFRHILEKRLSDKCEIVSCADGFYIKGRYEHGEACIVEAGRVGFHFCKTQRLPYTKDVAKTILLMYEYGFIDCDDCWIVMSDDDDNAYLKEALEELHAESPLVHYEAMRKILDKEEE
jgi:hypothetical protein